MFQSYLLLITMSQRANHKADPDVEPIFLLHDNICPLSHKYTPNQIEERV